MQTPTIFVILAAVAPPSTPHPGAGSPAAPGYDHWVAGLILIGSFLACAAHFRFLLSNRVSAARLKARRHRQGRVVGIGYRVEYPSWIDIAGHLVFKLALPQVLYFLIVSGSILSVWSGIAGAAVTILVILGREMEHVFSSSSARFRRRRYFLYRLGPVFATNSLLIGLLLHVAYLVLLLTFTTYGVHLLEPNAYQPLTAQASGALFACHLYMNFAALLWHTSAMVVPLASVAIFLSLVPSALCLILVTIFLADLRKLPKPPKPAVRPQVLEARGMKTDLTDQREVEAATLLVVESLTGKENVKAEENLFQDVGIDSLGFIELKFSLEEYFEIRLPDEDEYGLAQTPRQLSGLITSRLRVDRSVPKQPAPSGT